MRLHNIEFLRFLFAIIIVYFHILHSNIMNFVGNNEGYYLLQKLSDNAGWIVECFFIISGYFLYKSICEKKEVSVVEFILKKIFRLGPVLWFSIIISILFFGHSTIVGMFNALFLQCIGLSLDYKGINWYISPLFWALIFYCALFKNFDKQKTIFFVGVLVYFSYLVNITYCNGGFGRTTVYGIVNLGLARALAGLGLGYLIGYSFQFYNKIVVFRNELVKYLVGTVTEIFSFSFLMVYFLFGMNYKNDFIVVIVFCILFICFVNKIGGFSRLLDKNCFSILGRYAYSIYVMQQICFWILQKTLWQTTLINQMSVCLSISLLFSIFMGIVVYHLIEKPFYSKGISMITSPKHNM